MNNTIVLKHETRLAKVVINKYQAAKLKIDEGEHICSVLGIFQSTDGDASYPVFVCELETGETVEAAVGTVTFIDEATARLKAFPKANPEDAI